MSKTLEEASVKELVAELRRRAVHPQVIDSLCIDKVEYREEVPLRATTPKLGFPFSRPQPTKDK